MGKDLARRGKRRPKPDERPRNQDLVELAEALAEHTSAPSHRGWFELAWRDGYHAAELAFAAKRKLDASGWSDLGDPRMQTADEFLWKIFREHGEFSYADSWDILREIYGIRTVAAVLLAACLRCLQLKFSSSHGGGLGYNTELSLAFSRLDTELSLDVSDLVIEYRCRDAIGTSYHLKGDAFDRQRRAFGIAWQRGLYHAAYALRPIR